MNKNIVVIESPGKAKSWRNYSGMDVVPTFGHFKGLPKGEMGIDLKSYDYNFVVDNPKVVGELKKKAKGVDVYIAEDADREGAAIGRMVYDVVKSSANNVYRISTSEITKPAIVKAMENKVSYEKVSKTPYEAFLSRRLSDRIIGYILSPIVTKKLNLANESKVAFSVGRVQSCAVKLIYDREIEIESFKVEAYYSVRAKADIEGDKIELVHENDKFKTKEEAQRVIDSIAGQRAVVDSITNKTEISNPVAPYTTSTFQQDCSSKLGIPPTEAMKIAQKLYEGNVAGWDGDGLITYMRTDKAVLSDEFNKDLRDYIAKKHGANNLPASMIKHKAGKKGAQEAHEGIRPTNLNFDSSVLSGNEKAVYDLIMARSVASQMKPAVISSTTILFKIGNEVFGVAASMIEEAGYLLEYKRGTKKEVTLPKLNEGDSFFVESIEPKEHFTKPPARYTEASLVKKLEKEGIGRPSTYAPTIETIQKRGYVSLKKEAKGKIKPFYLESKGRVFIEFAVANKEVSWLLDYHFTKELEEDLDKVEEGQKNYLDVIKEIHSKMGFYVPKPKEKNLVDAFCLCCGGQLEETDKLFRCQNYQYDSTTKTSKGCQFFLFKDPLGLNVNTIKNLYEGEIFKVNAEYGLREFILDNKMVEFCKSGGKLKKGEGFIKRNLDSIDTSCPKCGGTLLMTDKAFQCENQKLVSKAGVWKNVGSCNFRVSKNNDHFGYVLDEAMLNRLISNEIINVGEKNIKLDLQSDYFIVDADYENKVNKTGEFCPYCQSEIVEFEKLFSCSATKKKSCKFKVWKKNEMKNYEINFDMFKRLINGTKVSIDGGRSLVFEKDNPYYITLSE